MVTKRSTAAVIGGGFLVLLIGLSAAHQGPHQDPRTPFRPASLTPPQPGGAGTVGMTEAPWGVSLERMDAALAEKNVSAAEMEWHRAYTLALRSRRWEGFVAVGDAYLRIGEVANGRRAAEARARGLYLDALFRARDERSMDGILRTAEAFAALGDREVVEQCLRVADQVAQRTPEPGVRESVNALRTGGRDRSPAVVDVVHLSQ